jgi:hypothetical protein
LYGRHAVGHDERKRYDDDEHDRCDIPHHPAADYTLAVPQLFLAQPVSRGVGDALLGVPEATVFTGSRAGVARFP